MPNWLCVANLQEIKPNCAKVITVNSKKIAIFNVAGQIYAIDDRCSHAEASLAEGTIEDDCTIECPLHGAKFDLKTGKNMSLPAVKPVASYQSKIEGKEIFLMI